MVLLRAAIGFKPRRRASIPAAAGCEETRCLNHQRPARRRPPLAYEATDTGLLSPELVAGIRRVKGVPRLGRRVGNWLSVAEGKELLLGTTAETLRQKRDAAIISFLPGCGLRRSEVVAVAFGDIQKREDHWAIVDLVGKAGHVRTAPVPAWVKTAVDEMDQERPYRQWQAVPLNSKKRNRLGRGIAQNVVWYVVKGCAAQVGIKALAPNALRRTCARLCHAAGGESEQIQFLLGHASVQTTERYYAQTPDMCSKQIQPTDREAMQIGLTQHPAELGRSRFRQVMRGVLREG